ncbi:MAG: aminopeptidase P family protein [bacterium]
MYRHRIETLLRRCEVLKIDALLLTSLPHIRYLSGFSGSHAMCFISPSNQYLVTDGRYREQIRQETSGYSLLITKGSLIQAMAVKIPAKTKMRIGIQSQYVTLITFENMKSVFPRVQYIPVGSLVDEQMAIKDESEISSIRKAVNITDRVWEKILGIIKDGMSELDIAAEISYFHKKFGAEADAFEPIVASGVRSALPHARSSSKILRRGELVVLDFGCRVDGYHSDLTRTIALGRASSEAKTIYHTVRHAQEQAIESAHEGMPAKTLDQIARRDLRRHSMAKYFTHSLGHGIGLQVHELPKVSSFSNDILAAGNVLTIEPGVYIPGFGGVRIEDDIVIRESTIEILNTATKELIRL